MSTTLTKAWLSIIEEIESHGIQVSPRGEPTIELPHATICVDTRHPVLLCKSRKLSYQFMAAEAYWILSGDDTVAGISPYNKHIANFSDDGKTFFGAYGPKIVGQLDYVVDKLISDTDTRQAGLTIWRENPPATKDVPCTVAIWFQRRGPRINCHVFMRSSDVWLGLPYDVFNFSMLTHLVCARINRVERRENSDQVLNPGDLYLTAASSHLYLRNRPGVYHCLHEATTGEVIHNLEETVYSQSEPTLELEDVPTPPVLYVSEESLMEWLKQLRETKAGDPGLFRWWEMPTQAIVENDDGQEH